MRNSGKAPIILLIVVIIISLVAAGGVFYLLQKEKMRNTVLQEQLDDVSAKQKITETKLEEAKKTIASLEFKLQEAGAEIEKTKAELATEKTAKEDAMSRADQLGLELDQQKNMKAALEVKFTQAQKDIEDTKIQLKDLSLKKSDLEKKITALEAQMKTPQAPRGVELGTVVVTNESPVPDASIVKSKQKSVKEKPVAKEKPAPKETAKPAPKEEAKPIVKQDVKPVAAPQAVSEAKVLVINKEYNFAVINLGSKDGVVMGDVFSIYHDNKFVGDVKVEKLHDSMAAAGYTSPDIKGKIVEGDKAVLKAK
ncbi:MAG: hypothetical protein V1650_00435 [Candidatus Omnitrophota bacterium]